MIRHLSLAANVSLAVGAIVFGMLSACALGTALWVERRVEIQQRAAVTLIPVKPRVSSNPAFSKVDSFSPLIRFSS